MATVTDRKIKSFCVEVNKELIDMKMKIDVLRDDLKRTYGAESDIVRKNEPHLIELADTIEEKLQLVTGNCSIEWKGTAPLKDAAKVGEDYEFV
jgi:hypothetical protein